MKSNHFQRYLNLCGWALFCLNLIALPVAVQAADEPSAGDRAKAAVEDTKQKAKDAAAAVEGAVKDASNAVTDATRTAGEKFHNLWRRVDESRLKNRTPDEIVAWVIMGVLVGAVAGMMTSLKTTGLGKLGRLLLGLAGAFLGGVVVHLTKVDFGMGPVLIRYEELLFSFAGAIVLLIAARLLRSGAKKKPA
jgi:uncharacterized membrane protein YeaQ/YmgE (transglycosylase-associated protein family)